MDKEKPKKKRKKAVAADDGAGEHKPNWREVYATVGRRGYRVVRYKPEEIEANRRLLALDVQNEEEGAGGAGSS